MRWVVYMNDRRCEMQIAHDFWNAYLFAKVLASSKLISVAVRIEPEDEEGL